MQAPPIRIHREGSCDEVVARSFQHFTGRMGIERRRGHWNRVGEAEKGRLG